MKSADKQCQFEDCIKNLRTRNKLYNNPDSLDAESEKFCNNDTCLVEQ